MYALIVILALRLTWPYGLFDAEDAWSQEALSSWRKYGEIAVGLALAQPDTTHYFVNQCYRGKTLSAAFGINFHFGNLTAGHLTGLRQLLLISGDVESNPGPVTETHLAAATCLLCDKTFSRKADLNQHIKVVHGEKVHRCTSCEYSTAKLSDIKRHQLKHQPSTSKTSSYNCRQCKHTAKRPGDLKRHMEKHANEPAAKSARYQESDKEIRKIVGRSLNHLIDCVANKEETALKRGLRVVELEAGGADPQEFLLSLESRIEDYIKDELRTKTGIKLQLVLSIQFFKQLEPENTIISGFRSRQMALFRGSELNLTQEFERILSAIDKFTKAGSGWVILQLLNLKLHMVTCKPLRGSSYRPLPKALNNKHAIINVQNSDQKCFIWSVLAQLYPADNNPQRVTKYRQYEDKLNVEGIQMPVPYHQIQKFETLNNLGVNVYGFDDVAGIHPLRITKNTKQPMVHLLHFDGHYSLIKSLNRLLYDQTKHKQEKFFCPMCLNHRSSQKLLDQHTELCRKMEPTKIVMPEEKNLKFTNRHKQLRQPLTIYADFECLVENIDSCNPNPDKSYTHKYQRHTPCGYGLVKAAGCCGNVTFSGLEVERRGDPVTRFLQSLMAVVTDYHNEPSAEMVDFDPAKHACSDCYICGEIIKDDKVKDHCHVCGKYRGPAHNACNQGLRLNKDVVVVFHNLRRYDGHLIMRKIGEAAKLWGFELNVVARAMEDYISFSLVHKKENDGKDGQQDFSYNIKFIDSVQFLNNSLEGLVANLTKEQCKAMTIDEFEGEKLDFLLRKGVYMYEYMDKMEKFREKQLPPKEKFYSQLTDEHISEDDYHHAERVWNAFDMKNLGDYHDLYLKTDVLLLADVFENFRKFALEKYGLDPCHYMTAPSLAWDACLKMTGVELEMLQDPEMYLFCESGIRGGISMISHRYAKANNPQMKDYDPNKPLSYIIYLDANNLYGWAMVQKLPVDGFRWLDHDLDRDWTNVSAEGERGYFLEVDLEYPADLHDPHNDYPLAPEAMEINKVSDYCEHLKDLMQINVVPCKKLVPNLYGKCKYILHIRNLQLYLRLGLKLKKVHRVLEFNQRAWMKDYIMFNTRMRAEATNDFDKDLLKLMNNAVFGKTMENVRKYRNIELVTSCARFEKLVASPRFKDSCRFTEDLVGVSSLRPSTCLNKPIYCGLTVLDLSKVLMYEFHYDYIIPKYGESARLLFTDTDSLCFWIRTDDIFTDMKNDADLFDFSGYPKNHFCYSEDNKKVIGKMKDEANGQIIEEFAGLRPKMYSIWGPEVEKKRAKGIKKKVVKNNITHQDYIKTLKYEDQMYHQMNLIRSDLHQMYSVTVNKKSLSAYDDKRWLINSIDSRAHGHYRNTVHALIHQDI